MTIGVVLFDVETGTLTGVVLSVTGVELGVVAGGVVSTTAVEL